VQLKETKAIKHSKMVIAYFRSHLSPNLSQWKDGSYDSYLWLWVNRGDAPDLFVCLVYAALDLFLCVVYTAPVGSKHKSKSLFQNLATNVVEVQTLGGI
jgi:hypothetical protein